MPLVIWLGWPCHLSTRLLVLSSYEIQLESCLSTVNFVFLQAICGSLITHLYNDCECKSSCLESMIHHFPPPVLSPKSYCWRRGNPGKRIWGRGSAWSCHGRERNIGLWACTMETLVAICKEIHRVQSKV